MFIYTHGILFTGLYKNTRFKWQRCLALGWNENHRLMALEDTHTHLHTHIYAHSFQVDQSSSCGRRGWLWLKWQPRNSDEEWTLWYETRQFTRFTFRRWEKHLKYWLMWKQNEQQGRFRRRSPDLDRTDRGDYVTEADVTSTKCSKWRGKWEFKTCMIWETFPEVVFYRQMVKRTNGGELKQMWHFKWGFKPAHQKGQSGPWGEFAKCKNYTDDINNQRCRTHFSSGST